MGACYNGALEAVERARGAPTSRGLVQERAFPVMRPETATAAQPSSLGVNERSVEVPWALARLAGAGRILDVGCAASTYLAELASQAGRAVYGLDPGEPPPVAGAGVVRGSVVAPPFRQGAFDLILCISTVEHIGLPIYGQHEFPHGDVLAMRHMRHLLARGGRPDGRPSGRLLLTVPFGRCQRNPWFRVYDAARLRMLTVGYRRLSETYFRLVREGEGRYDACDRKALQAAGYDFDQMRAEGVACLELVPTGGLWFALARIATRLLFAFERLSGKERAFLRGP